MAREPNRPPGWKEKDAQGISAQHMRRGVGWLAILLPVVIAAGYCLLGRELGGFLGSISESYHTLMRDIFVGTLCAEAFFLYAYQGYNEFEDRFFNTLAALCGVIAFFSMNPNPVFADPLPDPSSCHHAIDMAPTCSILLNDRLLLYHYEAFGSVHFTAATILFASLGYASVGFFTKTDSPERGPKKRRRDIIYKVCGYTIWAALAIFAGFWVASKIVPEVTWLQALVRSPFLFAVETVCLEAFGFSWLTKGNGVYGLSDPPEQH